MHQKMTRLRLLALCGDQRGGEHHEDHTITRLHDLESQWHTRHPPDRSTMFDLLMTRDAELMKVIPSGLGHFDIYFGCNVYSLRSIKR